jgi:hypothetical protein
VPNDRLTVLASLQLSDSLQNELRDIRVDLYGASPHELLLAVMLIGLERAPEHLFGRRITNLEAIGHLQFHPDPLVAQYAVWSVSENREWDDRSLRILLEDVPDHPANVRSRVFSLIGSHSTNSKRYQEFVVAWAHDPDPEARRGLAVGLRNVYFSGIEVPLAEWFYREHNLATRRLLLEHMGRHLSNSPNYADVFSDPQAQTVALPPLHSASVLGGDDFTSLQTETPIDMIGFQLGWQRRHGSIIVVNQTITGQQVNVGAVIGHGSATVNQGRIGPSVEQGSEVVDILSQIKRLVEEHAAGPDAAAEAHTVIGEALSKPGKPSITAALTWVRALTAGVNIAAAAKPELIDLADKLHQLVT